MKAIPLAFAFFVCSDAGAQKVVDVNANASNTLGPGNYYTVNGTPFVNTKFVNLVEGTPYLTDHWLKGTVLDKTGQRFGNALLKMDLLNNELHFIAKDGREMLATIDAKEMWLEDTVEKLSYHLVNAEDIFKAHDQNKWFLQLENGKVRLLKASLKLLSETLPYGTSIHEQRIHTKDKYYLEVNGSLVTVTKEKDIVSLLTDKKIELEAYLKMDKSDKTSREEKFKNLVAHYNSMFNH
jgi:hypothetical protein